MRVLGVDPGSRVTGWGLLETGGGDPRLVDAGRVRLPAGLSLARRLHRLRVEFEQIVRRTAPETSAVESPFHGANARSALQLAHSRGVILSILGGAGVPVEEYAPATIKNAVTGNGRADKHQVQVMIGRLVGSGRQLESADVADALAVALCHASSLTVRAALGTHAGRAASSRRVPRTTARPR